MMTGNPTAQPERFEAPAQTLCLDEVVVGKRHREDMGNLQALAESIRDLGLLQPIVVRPDCTLVAGERRLKAVRMLGWAEIPVYVARGLDEALALLKAERDENTCRKALNPVEAVKQTQSIRTLFEQEAAARKKSGKSEDGSAGGRGRKKPCGKLPQGNGRGVDKRKTRTRAAEAAGMKPRTYAKAEAVVQKAEENPERFGPVAEQMAKTGNVNAAYKTMRRLLFEQGQPGEAGEPCNVEDLHQLVRDGQVFQTIYCDPPWQYENTSTRAAAANHYPTMTVEEIAALPVQELAASEALLFLWTTGAFLPHSFRILEAWGFEYKTYAVWCKPQLGIGNYFRKATELLIVGSRGGLQFTKPVRTDWFIHDRRRHSAKPHEFRDIVARVSPAPRLELFGRELVPGWVVWGNQIAKTLFDQVPGESDETEPVHNPDAEAGLFA